MLSLVTLSLSFLLTFATAQSTAVTWLEPGPAAGAFSYAGAVLDACPGTTIIALQCTSGGADNAYSDICGTDGPSMTMTIGPSQVHFHGSTSTPGLDYEMDMTCDINESSATCTDSTSWSAVETSTESVETSTVAVASMATHTAEITEGAKKLDHTGKCTGVPKSEKGKGDKSSGERLAVSMGVVGLTSFVGMLLL